MLVKPWSLLLPWLLDWAPLELSAVELRVRVQSELEVQLRVRVKLPTSVCDVD